MCRAGHKFFYEKIIYVSVRFAFSGSWGMHIKEREMVGTDIENQVVPGVDSEDPPNLVGFRKVQRSLGRLVLLGCLIVVILGGSVGLPISLKAAS